MPDGGHGVGHVTRVARPRVRWSVGLELGGGHEDTIEVDGHDVVARSGCGAPIDRALSELHPTPGTPSSCHSLSLCSLPLITTYHSHLECSNPRLTALQLFSCYQHAVLQCCTPRWFTFYNDWPGPDSCQHHIMDGSSASRRYHG